MIKIEDTEVMGIRKAIRGMRNAMNSWDKSDSTKQSCDDYIEGGCHGCPYYILAYFYSECEKSLQFFIGEKDMELAKCLIKAGSSDRKFMRMIHVQADVTAPLYWWKEYDTYKVGTTSNSCSTMHKIHSKPITLNDFSIDDVEIEDGSVSLTLKDYFLNIVEDCEILRTMYNSTKDKRYWKALIQLLPSSFNQMRTIDLDYETLFSIYHQRKNHKLDEWREFCKWIETLPYMWDFLGLNDGESEEDKTAGVANG